MGKIGDFAGMLGRLRDMQSNMERVQQELEQHRVEASSGGGMVKAVVNGKGELVSIKIDPSVVNPDDTEMLEDLVTAAVTAATAKSREAVQEQLAQMTGGLNLPGMDQLSKMFT